MSEVKEEKRIATQINCPCVLTGKNKDEIEDEIEDKTFNVDLWIVFNPDKSLYPKITDEMERSKLLADEHAENDFESLNEPISAALSVRYNEKYTIDDTMELVNEKYVKSGDGIEIEFEVTQTPRYYTKHPQEILKLIKSPNKIK